MLCWDPGSSSAPSWRLWGEHRDRVKKQWHTITVATPILYVIYLVAVVMGILLWLSLWDLVVLRGQALYVLGLIVLLAFAAVEFLYFIALMSYQDRGQ